MCVIIAKNKNVDLPTIEDLKNCFNNNSDGAGFMYVENNEVIIDKGYMTLKSFLKHFKKLCNKYNNFKNKALVIHCRIGTSGGNIPQNTHPYIIDENIKKLKATYIKSDFGVAHNGIIYDYNPLKGENINDTQNFIMNFLAPLKKHYNDFYKNEKMLKAIEYLTNSKFAFLDNEENIYIVGDFQKHNGVLYSNSSYEEKKAYTFKSYYPTYTNYHTLDNWDYEENDYYKQPNEKDLLQLKDGFKIWCDYGYITLKDNGNNYYYDPINYNVYYKNGKDYRLSYENAIVYDLNDVEIF